MALLGVRGLFLLCVALVMLTELSMANEMQVDEVSFKVWRQLQRTTQKNHIKIRLKTIDATGMILFAQGANKKDFLSLELIRGKVRFAANYGSSPNNFLRTIDGYYEMFAGKDLADNHWHTIEIIRNIRETIIIVDKGMGPKVQKQAFRMSPPTYMELSVSMVTFAGYYSFSDTELSEQMSLARKGLKACFTEALFSQDWSGSVLKDLPLDQYVNFLGTGPSVVGNPPTIGCEVMQPPYAPLFFPSSAVHIAFLQRYTLPSMKIDLMFRTVVNEQTLANYTTVVTGEKVQVLLDRKGKLVLAVDIGKVTQIIETSRENYHDGLWHNVSFDIDNKPTSDNQFLAKFTVDGKTRLAGLASTFFFNGFVNIGFAFTGCMREIKVNGDDVYQVRMDSKKIPPEYFNVSDVGVVKGVCSLKDYCTPNPCNHGGKCNQTEDNIVCDCSNTLYEGSTCNRARFNYTCSGVRKAGERRSDVYYIDFDGAGPMEPVQALCDLGRTVETTTTQINNTYYVDLDVTTKSGYNAINVSYAASIIQARELIKNSAFCEQFIKYECKGTPIFRSPSGPPQVVWMGGDDILHYYWGGANNKRGYCQCGIEGKCTNKDMYCNCDNLDPFNNIIDEGNFTIKEHLPVRQVQFFSVLQGSVTGILRVGHLRCTGFGSHGLAATFRMPHSYLSVIHPDQPFDNLLSGQLSFDFKTSAAFTYMILANARGPFSGDYLKVVIWSRTLLRVYMDFGFGEINQDLDITVTGRTLDDNQWHEFFMEFNMKELNVTLDGVRAIQGLPLQDDPVVFNTDYKPMYIGGSLHDPYGFIGCMRSVYVGGRISDLATIAEGMQSEGVYPGCGSACPLLNRPCNYGDCIDEYDSFKCNCSTSPNDGQFCNNETYSMRFGGGQFLVYDLELANASEPVATALFVVGFTTSTPDVALAQLEGQDGRHLTLALVGGFATLWYSYKKKVIEEGVGIVRDTETQFLQIVTRRLNNNEHNIIKVRMSTEEIFLEVSNYNLVVGANVTERPIDKNDLKLGMRMDVFGNETKFTVGRITDLNIFTGGPTLPTGFTGCMSGAKLVIQGFPNAGHKVRQSLEFDVFRDFTDPDKARLKNPSGTPPTRINGYCGQPLPTPGVLPTVGPPKQYFTDSPGLDRSAHVPNVDGLNQAMILLVVCIVAIVLLGFMFLIYRYVNRTHLRYRELKPKRGAGKEGAFAYATAQSTRDDDSLPRQQPRSQPAGASSKEASSGGGGGFYL